MKIIVKNNCVFASHSNDQAVEALYGDMDVFILPDTFRKANGGGISIGDDLSKCLDLTTAKAMMRKHIETGLTDARGSGFLCSNGIKIQCAEIDMIRWMQAKAMVELASLPEIGIRDYGNVIHNVSAADLNTMLLEVGGYIQGLLSNAWTLKDAIDGADSITGILSARWSM
jgi:hypothetical protein